MRKLLDTVVAFVDRDVARWDGNPLGTLAIACMPMILWAIVTGQRPGDASAIALSLMLAPPVLLGSLGVWRGWRYLWSEHQRIRALGAAEKLDDEID
jgi:hypothetical protein